MGVNSVSEYLDTLNQEGKKYVLEFIDFMRKTYPMLNSKISFSMPMWLPGTKMNEGYIAVSAAKHHFSIHFLNEDFVCRLAKTLPLCKTGKRCINIKYGDENSFCIVKECAKEFMRTFLQENITAKK